MECNLVVYVFIHSIFCRNKISPLKYFTAKFIFQGYIQPVNGETKEDNNQNLIFIFQLFDIYISISRDLKQGTLARPLPPTAYCMSFTIEPHKHSSAVVLSSCEAPLWLNGMRSRGPVNPVTFKRNCCKDGKNGSFKYLNIPFILDRITDMHFTYLLMAIGQ